MSEEIASQMTKDVVTPDEEAEKNQAAGVGSLEDKPDTWTTSECYRGPLRVY